MPILTRKIVSTLTDGFLCLEKDARGDGQRHITRLIAEMRTDPSMFHAIYCCWVDERLVGIGAVTDEPASQVPVWRMRRLYVHRNFRRKGYALAIVIALLREAVGRVQKLTVNAGSIEASFFWTSIGFSAAQNQAWSHQAVVNDLTKLYKLTAAVDVYNSRPS